MSRGRSLELFFVDGRPDGMLTAEVFNWTGHVLRAPRTQLPEALKRREAGYTGVYLLIGEGDASPRLYIGEAEDLGSRLREHAKAKDWWDTVVMITTAANALHKAHIKYLESRLVEIARDVGAYDLENGNTPPRSSLSESGQASMESFLETLGMVLPAIRVDAFLVKKRVATADGKEAVTGASPEGESFRMVLPRIGIDARAFLRDGEWVVREGSQVRSEWVGDRSYDMHYWKARDALQADGTIAQIEGSWRFTADFAFSSPSAAAAVVAGTSRNGRLDWKHTATGQTYAEWEAAQLEQDTP